MIVRAPPFSVAGQRAATIYSLDLRNPMDPESGVAAIRLWEAKVGDASDAAMSLTHLGTQAERMFRLLQATPGQRPLITGFSQAARIPL
jgi:putative heme iron utilization protein